MTATTHTHIAAYSSGIMAATGYSHEDALAREHSAVLDGTPGPDRPLTDGEIADLNTRYRAYMQDDIGEDPDAGIYASEATPALMQQIAESAEVERWGRLSDGRACTVSEEALGREALPNEVAAWVHRCGQYVGTCPSSIGELADGPPIAD